MNKKKLFALFIETKDGEEANFNTHIEFNLRELISDEKLKDLLTEDEVKQIQDIALNVCKRVNKINGFNELRTLDIPN